MKNCSRCGKVYLAQTGLSLCRDCVQASQEEFEKVRAYLRDHPQSDVITVSEATEVPKKKILEYLRDGRLTFAASQLELACDRCGTPISIGRFCPGCAEEIKGQSGTFVRPTQQPDAAPIRDFSPAPSASSKVIRDKFRRR